MDRLLYRVMEAANALGISRSQTYELVHQGELPAIRIGGVIRIPVDALRTWIDEQMGNGGAVVPRPHASSVSPSERTSGAEPVRGGRTMPSPEKRQT
jgi:excisionase family DNA binding protein